MGEHALRLGRSLDASVKTYNQFAASLESQVLTQARRFEELQVDHEARAVPELGQIEAGVRELTKLVGGDARFRGRAGRRAAARRSARLDARKARSYLGGMSLRRILTVDSDLATLKQKSVAVAEVDDALRALMDDMLETMYAAPGIGLAAIQVGEPVRVIVMDLSRGDGRPRAAILRQSGDRLGVR